MAAQRLTTGTDFLSQCISYIFLPQREARNKMEQWKRLSVGIWALHPEGWVPGQFASLEGQGQENTSLGPGQA